MHEVKRRLIDSLGLRARRLERGAVHYRARGRYRFFGKARSDGYRHIAQSAAGLGGIRERLCIRYFDYNDTYLSKEPAHPSDNFSAVLAIGESVGATGKEIITATAIAYEVQCRFCDAASIRARGWDHPTYGAFSTALACAKLMKLDPERTRHAINIAGVAWRGHAAGAGRGVVALERRRVCELPRVMACMRRCLRAPG